MKEKFLLTDGVFVTPTYGYTQPLYNAVDVSKYEKIDLHLVVTGMVSGGGLSGPAYVTVFTGDSRDANDIFFNLAAFPTIRGPQTTYKITNIRNHRRFIYWSVTASRWSDQPPLFIIGTGYW